jgi:hypothetical protein
VSKVFRTPRESHVKVVVVVFIATWQEGGFDIEADVTSLLLHCILLQF